MINRPMKSVESMDAMDFRRLPLPRSFSGPQRGSLHPGQACGQGALPIRRLQPRNRRIA